MALVSSITGQTVFGNKKITYGTFTSDTTTGDITTGLSGVDTMMITAKGSSVVADAPTINETFPLAGGDVTVICTSSTVGFWLAVGK